MPRQEHGHYPQLQQKIETLFAQNQKDGSVRLEYDCIISYGQFE